MNQKQCRRSWFIHRPSVFRKSSTLFAVNSEKSYSESAEVIANQYIDAGSSTSKIDSETAFSLYAVNKRPWFIYKPSVFNKSGAKSFAIPPELGTESFCRDSDLENASSPQGSENLVEIRDSENWFGRQPSVFKKSFQAKPEGNNYISKPNGDGRIGMASCEEIPLDNVSLNESDWSVLNLESCDTDIGSDLENSVEDIENYIDKNMLA
uniref:Uncharacterized protein n=1 Tax=Ditylenchus dipsaci TaxID=166011 RepID=A0A915DKK6_9BILA